MDKIKFILSPEYDIKMISHFVSPDKESWDWSKKVFRFHPKLKEKLEGIEEIKKRDEIVKDYVKDWFRNPTNYNKIQKRKKDIEKKWLRIHNKFISILKEKLNLKQHKQKTIICSVSINPICPRNLNTNFFSVFYNYDINFIPVVIAHEITHFFYFDKWRETFPNSDSRTFEGPHIIWHLSEIMAPIILSEPKIQKLLNKLDTGYKEHGKIKIEGKNIIEHFDILYKNFDKKKDFGEFLKMTYKEIRKYEKELKKL